MRYGIARIAVVAALLVMVGGAAQAQPVYSFETENLFGPDGFFGLGAAVTQDTIGATHGQFSMKYDIGNNGFVGARTESVIPATLNDPPGVNAVLFDMTLVNPYAGGFADIGITLFGHALNANPAQFGLQVQFADTEPIAGRAAGTYPNLRIALDNSVGPYRAGESFNAIFGPNPNDLTMASAFQFFISKNVDVPLTVYIDNVRLELVPEPASCVLFGFAAVAACGFLRRSRG